MLECQKFEWNMKAQMWEFLVNPRFVLQIYKTNRWNPVQTHPKCKISSNVTSKVLKHFAVSEFSKIFSWKPVSFATFCKTNDPRSALIVILTLGRSWLFVGISHPTKKISIPGMKKPGILHKSLGFCENARIKIPI